MGHLYPTGVPGTQFRLDPFAKRMGEGTEPTQEKLELYEAAGWKYAFPIGRAYFLFYTTDPAPPELYTDRERCGLSLDRRAKRSQFLLSDAHPAAGLPHPTKT